MWGGQGPSRTVQPRRRKKEHEKVICVNHKVSSYDMQHPKFLTDVILLVAKYFSEHFIFRHVKSVGFEFFTAAVMMTMAFVWVLAPCTLGCRCGRFGDIYCLNLRPWRWRLCFSETLASTDECIRRQNPDHHHHLESVLSSKQVRFHPPIYI
jgi:hypothetical protein